MTTIWIISPHFMMRHGIIMLCLGMALCSLGSFMTNPKVEASGYMMAVCLTAACLLSQAIFVFIRVMEDEIWRHREFYIYLCAGILFAVCWLVFWLNRLAPLDTLVLLAGLQGLLLSLWYVGLALHLQVYPRKAGVLCVLAGLTSSLGIILSTQSDLSHISTLTAVACYITWIGIQTILTAPYLLRSWNGTTEGESLAKHYRALTTHR